MNPRRRLKRSVRRWKPPCKPSSPNADDIDFYKQLHGYYEQLQENVKEARADLKRTAEKLAKAHPDSESIKHGFTIAIMA